MADPLGSINNPVLVKQSDTRPKITGNAWQGSSATPINITGATVVFNMRLAVAPNTIVANRVAATVVSGTAGSMSATLTSTITAVVGLYQAEFEVTFTDGGILTFPSGDNYIYIKVGDDIA